MLSLYGGHDHKCLPSIGSRDKLNGAMLAKVPACWVVDFEQRLADVQARVAAASL